MIYETKIDVELLEVRSLNQPFDFPRSEDRGLLRVDTGGAFDPVLKDGIWHRRSIKNL